MEIINLRAFRVSASGDEIFVTDDVDSVKSLSAGSSLTAIFSDTSARGLDRLQL